MYSLIKYLLQTQGSYYFLNQSALADSCQCHHRCHTSFIVVVVTLSDGNQLASGVSYALGSHRKNSIMLNRIERYFDDRITLLFIYITFQRDEVVQFLNVIVKKVSANDVRHYTISHSNPTVKSEAAILYFFVFSL